MADVFYTVLVVWVIWRIFGKSNNSTVHHKHTYEDNSRREGEVTIKNIPKDENRHGDAGEYVDFEEVK